MTREEFTASVDAEIAHLMTQGVRQIVGPDKHGSYTYGDWTISYDPPPIPIRSMDWEFSHRDFDADWDDDGYHGNGLCGRAGSLAECLEEIADIEEDHPHFAATAR